MKFAKALRTATVLVFAVILLAQACGCGYYAYRAYYLPEGTLSLRYEEKRKVGWLELTGSKVGTKTLLYFARPYYPDNRECFAASVEVLSAQRVIESFQGEGPAEESAYPTVDSVVITCRQTQLIAVLETSHSHVDTLGYEFESDSICLPRKHKYITVQYTVRWLSKSGQLLFYDQFEQELVRWEDRDWLGLQ